jgi:hypothetical protein
MNSGQNVAIHRNNLDFKRLSLGRTTGDGTQMNIDKPSCPTFSCKTEDRKENRNFVCSRFVKTGDMSEENTFIPTIANCEKISDEPT